ncbi:MAG: glycosyltransferase family 4 protein [Patescibacteria group bacterium]|nr:glycosyltransferase family 4 protein [Patescibacteria group bacterium]MDD5490742.1 glycosyltransferase family 4 protein [Patescibacteria group bacterium]
MIGQKGIPAIYGGIEKHVEELSVRLAGFGVEVSVYCRPWYSNNGESLKVFKGVNLVYLPSLKTKHLDAISHTFLATLHALYKKADIIHYHGVGPSLLAWLPRILSPRTKVITTFHCIDRKHQKWGWFAKLSLRLGEWAACRFAHKTIAVSKVLKQYCNEVYDCETIYIPNGVNVEPAREFGDNLIKQFGLERGNYIAMVSRLVKHKGAHYLIEAFRGLKTNLKLVIVGGSAFTDKYVGELKDLAGDNSDIIFTGFQSGETLKQLFSNALFIVHPSESEGLPISVLEAMSFGKVALTSDIPENLEAVENYGYTFSNKSVLDLREKIKILISNKKDLESLGAKARDFVGANYNWDKIARQVCDNYFSLMPGSEAGAVKELGVIQN